MSQRKIKKEDGQVFIKTLLHQSAKKRTPPSAERPNRKKSHIDPVTPPSGDLQNKYLSNMESDDHSDNISKDSRFSNFSDEFIAFGNMMCQKLNKIVEPLKTSQENMQDNMRLLLEDRQNYKNINEVCSKVEGQQQKITGRCDRMEQENKEL